MPRWQHVSPGRALLRPTERTLYVARTGHPESQITFLKEETSPNKYAARYCYREMYKTLKHKFSHSLTSESFY